MHLMRGRQAVRLVGCSASSGRAATGTLTPRHSAGTTQTLIEHWHLCCSWSIVPSPSPAPDFSVLYAVAGVSPDDIWGVGNTTGDFGQTPLTEHWDGTTWSVVPSPSVDYSHLY